jgi:V/A-type H+-transporting ATPase subunit B
MNSGIGDKKTREDHKGVSDQLYAGYANGRDLRSLSAVVGEEALSATDRRYLRLADEFEKKFVQQGPYENRDIEKTLDIAWDLLALLPEDELKRVKKDHIPKYMKKIAEA